MGNRVLGTRLADPWTTWAALTLAAAALMRSLLFLVNKDNEVEIKMRTGTLRSIELYEVSILHFIIVGIIITYLELIVW